MAPASPTGPAAPAAPARDGPIQIKVLRLSRPHLEPADAATGPTLPTPHLVLPRSGHTAYVGEEFGLLVSVNALADITVDVAAEVRNPLGVRLSSKSSGKDPIPVEKDSAYTLLVPFSAKEVGTHLLTVDLRWEDDLQAREVRKTFKFEASKAIAVRHKLSHASGDAYVLEAQVDNLSDSALTIESCALAPAQDQAVHALAKPVSVLLRPRDVHQWCFITEPGATRDVGHLSVTWRREPLGSRGWQSTGLIQM